MQPPVSSRVALKSFIISEINFSPFDFSNYLRKLKLPFPYVADVASKSEQKLTNNNFYFTEDMSRCRFSTFPQLSLVPEKTK